MKLTEEQIQQYKDEGYLIVQSFLSPETCDALSSHAHLVAAGYYTNILNLHDKSKAFMDLMTSRELLEIVDQIQEARMIPIGSIFFFCKPGNDLEQGSNMHQDNYAPKAPYGSYFVVGLALDDAAPENGSLIIYPGTHHLGDLENTPTKNFEMEDGKISKAYPIGNEAAIPIGYKPLQLTYKKGDLILLHGHTVHGAPKNRSQVNWRRKIYLHYIKDGDPFWPGWNAKRRLIERG